MRPAPLTALTALTLALLAACGGPPRLTNLEPAQQAARAAQPAPGSLYAGWRVFQQRCAACHGTAADGAGGGANLLQRMPGLSAPRFVDLVLRRYESLVPGAEGSAREQLVDDIVERRRGDVSMPAWQDNPMVQAHLMDLFAYLQARADGRLPAAQAPAR